MAVAFLFFLVVFNAEVMSSLAMLSKCLVPASRKTKLASASTNITLQTIPKVISCSFMNNCFCVRCIFRNVAKSDRVSSTGVQENKNDDNDDSPRSSIRCIILMTYL